MHFNGGPKPGRFSRDETKRGPCFGTIKIGLATSLDALENAHLECSCFCPQVVQIYRTEVSISKADKVVFIPVDLADFTNNDFIRRF